EDVGSFDRVTLLGTVSGIAADLRALAATHEHGRLLREGIRVVIVGKPNAGKSSLLNRLIGSDRAIVTAVAGTTRDVIAESVAIESAADAVGHAVEAIGSGIPPDVIGVDIMTALDHLREIAGATSAEDVLDRIFSEFCIGK